MSAVRTSSPLSQHTSCVQSPSNDWASAITHARLNLASHALCVSATPPAVAPPAAQAPVTGNCDDWTSGEEELLRLSAAWRQLVRFEICLGVEADPDVAPAKITAVEVDVSLHSCGLCQCGARVTHQRNKRAV
jgi:hypothetical protein